MAGTKSSTATVEDLVPGFNEADKGSEVAVFCLCYVSSSTVEVQPLNFKRNFTPNWGNKTARALQSP